MVEAARRMLLNHPADGGQVEQATPGHGTAQQTFADPGVLGAEQPGGRTGEALFGPVQHFARQQRFQRALEDVFALAAVQLQRGRQRQAPGDEFIVQQRGPHLQRVGHAGAVHLGQDVAGQPGLQVGVLRCQQGVFGGGVLHQRGEAGGRIITIQAGAQGRGVQRAAAGHLDLGHRAGIAQRTVQAEFVQRVLGAQPARCAVELRVVARQRANGMAAQTGGHMAAHAFHQRMPAIAPVAGEYLVTAVARQRHGGVAAGQRADAVGGYRRDVAERLTEDAALQAGGVDHVHCCRTLIVLGGAVAPGDHGGERGFVLAALEADGEGIQRRLPQPGGQRHHGG